MTVGTIRYREHIQKAQGSLRSWRRATMDDQNGEGR